MSTHRGINKLLFGLLMAVSFSSFALEDDFVAETGAPATSLQWGFVSFPPWVYTDANGEVKGELAKLMRRISEDTGVRYTPIQMPNARAIFSLNNHQINFTIGMKSLVENKADFIFSDLPVSTVQLAILWQSGSRQVETKAALEGKRLILLRGYTYGGLREELNDLASDVMEVETIDRAERALKLGRGDYALIYLSKDPSHQQKYSELDLEYTIIQEIDLFFTLSLSTPNATAIMQLLQSSYRRGESSSSGR